MIWGSSTWSISHHAGFNALCLCCCDEEQGNPGGSHFPDSGKRQRGDKDRRANPFMRLRTQRHSITLESSGNNRISVDGPAQFGTERESAAGSRLVPGTSRPADELRTVLGDSALHFHTGLNDEDWLLILVVAEDEP